MLLILPPLVSGFGADSPDNVLDSIAADVDAVLSKYSGLPYDGNDSGRSFSFGMGTGKLCCGGRGVGAATGAGFLTEFAATFS